MKQIFRKMVGIILLLAMCIVNVGCNNGQGVQNTEENGIEGYAFRGIMYQEDAIIKSDERIYATDWEDLELEIICMDPSCVHEENDKCSANGFYGYPFQMTAMKYGEKLLVFESYVETKKDETETITQSINYTDVYECDIDGTNRKKITSFEGMWTSAGIVYQNKLYFNTQVGTISTIVEDYIDEEGIPVYESTQYGIGAFCSLDLETKEFVSYIQQEIVPGSTFEEITVIDEHMYCTLYNLEGERILYRIDLATDTCDELYCSSNYFSLKGTIGHKLLFATENIETMKYDYYLYDEQTKQTTCIRKDASEIACVVGNEFMIMTESVMETQEKDYAVAYEVFDTNGNHVNTINYNENIQFWFTFKEHLIYRFVSDEDPTKNDRKAGVYEVNIKDIGQMQEYSKYITSGSIGIL